MHSTPESFHGFIFEVKRNLFQCQLPRVCDLVAITDQTEYHTNEVFLEPLFLKPLINKMYFSVNALFVS